jgi:hypothetical protein
VLLSLMEMLPFGKGASDIIWALPFLGLIIFALAMSGLVVGLIANPCSHTGWQVRDHRVGVKRGGARNLAVGRLLVSTVGLTNP